MLETIIIYCRILFTLLAFVLFCFFFSLVSSNDTVHWLNCRGSQPGFRVFLWEVFLNAKIKDIFCLMSETPPYSRITWLADASTFSHVFSLRNVFLGWSCLLNNWHMISNSNNPEPRWSLHSLWSHWWHYQYFRPYNRKITAYARG